MKKILTIALLLIAINAQGQGLPVAANATLASLFPDENLRAVVAEVLGPNAGLIGQRLSDELARIDGRLDASSKNIRNASGIEYLLGLTRLNLSYNFDLLHIDLSHNIKLIHLEVSYTGLSNIDVSNLSQLMSIGLFRTNATVTIGPNNHPLLDIDFWQ